MPAKTVADQLVEIPAAAGDKRISGIVADNVNGVTDTIRCHGKIEWIHVGHAKVAAFAAGTEAHLTGEMAEAVGIGGIRLEDPGQVTEGIAAALAHDGPVLIDAVVNRAPAVTLERAKGFTLYMVRAVISGRADEVVDLASPLINRGP